jgi:hypothetical protein
MKEKESVPLFNLNLKLDDWKGPFDSFSIFLRTADLAKTFSRLHDQKFHILSHKYGGELASGNKEGLHTYNGTIGLYEYNIDHIHYGTNGKHDKMSKFDIREGDKFILDAVGINPIYTLEGLYTTLEDEKMTTKIRSLSGELEKHTSFDPNEILKNHLKRTKETKLKLLENKYKNLVLK